MRCLAVCHTELVARLLEAVLAPHAEVELLVESAALARRVDDFGLPGNVADPQRLDSFVKADLTPGTVVIIEDSGRKGLRRILDAAVGAGGTLVYILGTRPEEMKKAEALRADFPDVNTLTLAELFGRPLLSELARSVTRQKVQQNQHYFRDADRVLILMHNDPDPDALASGLALRSLLRRTRQTAIIGCMQGVTRPENQRMVKLLDLHYEVVTGACRPRRARPERAQDRRNLRHEGAGRRAQGATTVRDGHTAFDSVLKEADVMSLHIPLTPETRHMISTREFGLMKPSALLINTARGNLVDEPALAEALKSGQIAGAGFDVLSVEPPRAGNPLLDLDLPNFILTPHVAWSSRDAMQIMADQLVDYIEAFVAGTPRNVVT